MKFSYDDTYWPPIPVIDIVLRNNDRDLQTLTRAALVDSGADATLVPLSLLSTIKAHAVGDTQIRSHWGERRRVHLYRIDIKLNHMTLPGIMVVGGDFDDEVVLGRDVLNKLRLLLDGPAAHTEILD